MPLDTQVNPYVLTNGSDDFDKKMALRRNLNKLSAQQLQERLTRQVRENKPDTRLAGQVHPVIRAILDSTSTAGGNVLPRVDLEQTIYSLFLKQFPFWDRIKKAPSNGLSHSWNYTDVEGSVTDANMTLASDLTNAPVDVSNYAQTKVVNMAIIDTLRGVSLKELLATQQSGMNYDPASLELANGVVHMKKLVQKLLLQGNQSVSTGTAANEKGLTNANGFDGLRLITGGLGQYSVTGGVKAIQVNQDDTAKPGPYTISKAINYATAQIMDQGGTPTAIISSSIAYMNMMDEQEGKQRAVNTSELIPGVQVPAIATTAGDLPVVRVPGAANALGSYLRTSDSASVEDLYILSEDTIYWRYLGSPDITVLEIPMGVDTQLSRRFILFMIGGLQVADLGVFQGKVRLPR